MSARQLVMFVAGVVATLAVASPASASLGAEVSAGRAVAAQLQSGRTSCAALSGAQFEHLGEYVMERMVGSRAAHEAMNERMTRAIGTESTDRMHELMGRRFAACAGRGAAGVPMGPGMMGGSGGGGWGMMGGSGWSWMRDGSWQHMSRSQWRALAGTMMGSRSVVSGHGGWSTGAVVGVLLVAALLAVLLMWRPWRRRPPAASSAA